MQNKLLIFDFDGTLVDSLPLWQKVDNIFFNERRGINYSMEDIDFRPMSIEEAAEATREVYGVKDSIESIMHEWIEIVDELYLKEDILRDGAYELIQKAKKENYKLAIGTNNTIKLVQSYLEKENIQSYFDLILTADDVENSKPKPDIFLEVANRLKVSENNSIVIEDSLAGTKAGKAANMYTYTIEEKESLEHKKEILKITDKYIKSLYEVKLF